jgi:hypothetical protein
VFQNKGGRLKIEYFLIPLSRGIHYLKCFDIITLEAGQVIQSVTHHYTTLRERHSKALSLTLSSFLVGDPNWVGEFKNPP